MDVRKTIGASYPNIARRAIGKTCNAPTPVSITSENGTAASKNGVRT